jgi:hypothetical protein
MDKDKGPPPDPKPAEDSKPQWPTRREIYENEVPKDYLSDKSL